jgi:hypothetical protein
MTGEFDVVTANVVKHALVSKSLRDTSATITTSGNVWQTAFTVSGSGRAFHLRVRYSISTANLRCRITVDGGTAVEVYPLPTASTGTVDANLPLFIRFKTSLKVEVANNSGTSTSLATYLTWGDA